ncbi:hypothetical protein KSW81_000820 [Nannochloris sp. 'desiccata']|nr:hypothetical protein KSW81_000820 [Chlorella desiccata (nom. nud.)]
MLRQCSSELSGAQNAGDQCCELLSAFDLRECAMTDDRVKSFKKKYFKLLQPLRLACDVPVPSPSAEPNDDANDDALELAADSLSKARDSSMYDNIISVARAVMATDSDSARVVTVELAVEGGVEDVEAAVKFAVNKAAALAKSTSKKGGIMLQEISLEMEKDDHGALCSCENAVLPELTENATSSVALRYAYLAARLSICKFTCAHKGLVLGGMILQMAVLSALIMFILARPLWARRTRGGGISSAQSSGTCSATSNSGQFIADAGDGQWTEPLLPRDEEEGMASGRDTSVDTSCTNVQDEADLSEPREVRTIFGEIGRGTQGPAGAPVPGEEPEFMEFEDIDDRVEYRYSDEPEAPEDAMGPVPRIGHIGSFSLDELTKDNEAVVAATAEAEAEANHPSSLSPEQGNSPQHAKKNASSLLVNETLRRKVVKRIASAFTANSKFLGDATAAATDCEKAVYESSRSLTVYQSIAANAARVAREAAGLAEVLRVARGCPREQHGGMPVGQDTGSIAQASMGRLPEAIVKMDYT